MLNYNETSMPDMFSKETKLNNFDVSRDAAHYVLDVTIGATTEALKQLKSKEYPLAFVYKTRKDEFIAAAVVNYNDKKNWDYFWTFDKAEVPENAHILTADDPKNASYFRGFGASKYGMGFDGVDAIYILTNNILYTISKWLDENAKDDETVEVELTGTGIFSVSVNDKGEKEKKIVVDGEYKVEVKDDDKYEE